MDGCMKIGSYTLPCVTGYPHQTYFHDEAPPFMFCKSKDFEHWIYVWQMGPDGGEWCIEVYDKGHRSDYVFVFFHGEELRDYIIPPGDMLTLTAILEHEVTSGGTDETGAPATAAGADASDHPLPNGEGRAGVDDRQQGRREVGTEIAD